MAFEPSFDGVPGFFGLAPVVVPIESEAAWQFNAYPGVNGLEALFMGARGGMFQATGVLAAQDAPTLATIEESIRSYIRAGIVTSLTDATGTTWTDVVMRTYHPAEEIRVCDNPYPNGVTRAYQMTLVRLT